MKIGDIEAVKGLIVQREAILGRLQRLGQPKPTEGVSWVSITCSKAGVRETTMQLDDTVYAELTGLLRAVTENERDAIEKKLEALGVTFDA